jgi:hypothetical protein
MSLIPGSICMTTCYKLIDVRLPLSFTFIDEKTTNCEKDGHVTRKQTSRSLWHVYGKSITAFKQGIHIWLGSRSSRFIINRSMESEEKCGIKIEFYYKYTLSAQIASTNPFPGFDLNSHHPQYSEPISSSPLPQIPLLPPFHQTIP